jgi:hypothetical protein
MLRRQFIFVYLLTVVVVVFAQRSELNAKNQKEYEEDEEVENDKLPNQPQQQNQPPESVEKPSVNNVRPPIKSADAKANSGNANQNQINRLVPGNQKLAEPTAVSASLANSTECKADVQRYCVKKGGPQLIVNMKVLQCMDDLDNVSLSK